MLSIGNRVEIKKIGNQGDIVACAVSVYEVAKYQVEYVDFYHNIRLEWFYGEQLRLLKSKNNIVPLKRD